MTRISCDNMGILVTSYPPHLRYIKLCFRWIAKMNVPVIFGWGDILPYPSIPPLPETVTYDFHTKSCLGVVKGELTQIRIGLEKLKEFGVKYVFKVSGDQTILYPEVIPKFFERLGENKVLYYSKKRKQARLETKSFFGEIDSILQILAASGVDMPRAKLQERLYKAAMSLGIPVRHEVTFWHFDMDWRHYFSHKMIRRPELKKDMITQHRKAVKRRKEWVIRKANTAIIKNIVKERAQID